METITINPQEYAMRLTTTLNRLHEAGACVDRYQHLLTALGGVSFDHDEPINLLTILEHNGPEDCLWALRATAENCDVVARLMAADFAESALPIFERAWPGEQSPRVAINSTRAFALGLIDAAAMAAARSAVWAIVESTVTAAESAVLAAAWAAESTVTAAESTVTAAESAITVAESAITAAESAITVAEFAITVAEFATWSAQEKIIRLYLLSPGGSPDPTDALGPRPAVEEALCIAATLPIAGGRI